LQKWGWLLVIGYWLLVIGYWLLVIGYWLLVIDPMCDFFLSHASSLNGGHPRTRLAPLFKGDGGSENCATYEKI
jgi:hypothetical protein